LGAVSRLFSTLLPPASAMRRQGCRRGTHECARHVRFGKRHSLAAHRHPVELLTVHFAPRPYTIGEYPSHKRDLREILGSPRH
jgi:hypothetical protein